MLILLQSLPVASINVTETYDADFCIIVCLKFWVDYYHLHLA
jgi:hypothetical protein